MWSNYQNGVYRINSDHLYCADEGGSYGNGLFATKKPIDLSKYSKLYGIVSASGYSNNGYIAYVDIVITEQNYNHASSYGSTAGYHYTEISKDSWTLVSSSGSIDKQLFEIDISNIDEGTVQFKTWSGALDERLLLRYLVRMR